MSTTETYSVVERPILFSGRMVAAILAGRKTQTRRIVRPQPSPSVVRNGRAASGWDYADHFGNSTGKAIVCPYGVPGDRLWVRETWAMWPMAGKDGSAGLVYRATCTTPEAKGYWKPAIFMPRSLSRITLEVVSVRVERLQKITEEDALAEGSCVRHGFTGAHAGIAWTGGTTVSHPLGSARECFENGWDTINRKRGPWASNPWVWVVEFSRVKT